MGTLNGGPGPKSQSLSASSRFTTVSGPVLVYSMITSVRAINNLTPVGNLNVELNPPTMTNNIISVTVTTTYSRIS
jgi:hypothetical protein